MSESEAQKQQRTLGNAMQSGNVLGHDLVALVNRRIVGLGDAQWLHMGQVLLSMDAVVRIDANRAEDGSVRLRAGDGKIAHALLIPAGVEGNVGEAIGDGAGVPLWGKDAQAEPVPEPEADEALPDQHPKWVLPDQHPGCELCGEPMHWANDEIGLPDGHWVHDQEGSGCALATLKPDGKPEPEPSLDTGTCEFCDKAIRWEQQTWVHVEVVLGQHKASLKLGGAGR